MAVNESYECSRGGLIKSTVFGVGTELEANPHLPQQGQRTQAGLLCRDLGGPELTAGVNTLMMMRPDPENATIPRRAPQMLLLSEPRCHSAYPIDPCTQQVFKE